MFLDELKTVKEIAEYLVLHHNDYHGAYFRAFFPSNREGSAAAAALFDNIARAADPQDTSKEFRVTCSQTAIICPDQDRIAFTWSSGRTLNLCPEQFFSRKTSSPEAYIATSARIADIKAVIANVARKGSELPRDLLQRASHSRAMIIIHELTHLPRIGHAAVQLGPILYRRRQSHENTLDFAYGLKDCLLLRQGRFFRDPNYVQNPGYWCGENPDVGGFCPPSVAWMNADSWEFLATGVWMSKQIGVRLPIPRI